MTKPLYHGGAPDLRPGELLTPGHERKQHDNCPWCQANAQAAKSKTGYDGHSGHTDQSTHVYATTNRLYAKFHASLYGYGDLYRVTPVGDSSISDEDTIHTIKAPAMRIEAVIDRAVRLTNTERRRLAREWDEADRTALRST